MNAPPNATFSFGAPPSAPPRVTDDTIAADMHGVALQMAARMTDAVRDATAAERARLASAEAECARNAERLAAEHAERIRATDAERERLAAEHAIRVEAMDAERERLVAEHMDRIREVEARSAETVETTRAQLNAQFQERLRAVVVNKQREVEQRVQQLQAPPVQAMPMEDVLAAHTQREDRLRSSFSAELARVREEHAAALTAARGEYERKLHNWRTSARSTDRDAITRELEGQFTRRMERQQREDRAAENSRLSVMEASLQARIDEATAAARAENAELRVAMVAKTTQIDQVCRDNLHLRGETEQATRAIANLQRELAAARAALHSIYKPH